VLYQLSYSRGRPTSIALRAHAANRSRDALDSARSSSLILRETAVKIATIQSVCECQAGLHAELGEQKQVLKGWATDRRRNRTVSAPAHSMHAGEANFQVGWACPLCGRNTLRSFDLGGLAWHNAPAA
jgi:hypothetical protein